MNTSLIVTCEHGGNRVPAQYAALFRGHQSVLASHRGHDCGSQELARILAQRLGAPLFTSTVTRLLVELNRSPHHRGLFSEFAAGLDNATKQGILNRYYFPYRHQVESAIAAIVAQGDFALHVSTHTFTPRLNGQLRNADIGLLYDPGRPAELKFCQLWRTQLRTRRHDLRIRRNYPYLGKADGFTTYLRRQFRPTQYAGIELEVNLQCTRKHSPWKQLQDDLTQTLANCLLSVDR